jgi:antitoxin component YwqK of YwqJK toxin-antitoxin module
MNRLLLFALILSFFTPLSSCRQKEVVETKNEAGKLVERYTIDPRTKLKDGLHETFFTTTGGKSEESTYKVGVLHGEQIFYYETGQVMERRIFDKDGNFSGSFKSYHENGHLKSEGQYENGSMVGKWKFFYRSGNVKEIIHYKNNVENGPFIEYYENGKVSAEGTYMDELEHGLLKMYDNKGNLTSQKQCENGVCHTVWKSPTASDSVKKM